MEYSIFEGPIVSKEGLVMGYGVPFSGCRSKSRDELRRENVKLRIELAEKTGKIRALEHHIMTIEHRLANYDPR